jgi:hypothetical protein
MQSVIMLRVIMLNGKVRWSNDVRSILMLTVIILGIIAKCHFAKCHCALE